MDQEPIVLERATTANGEIQLQKRGNDYEIIFNGIFLMATYNGESERLLVRWAVERAKSPQRVLLGGLGVGFSLDEACKNEQIESIKVVEVERKIIQWNSTYLAPYSHKALQQRKVEVVNADFVAWLKNATEKFDVICLDIDNGPEWVVMDENKNLYNDAGICALIKLLHKSGVISFWSATKSDRFAQVLKSWFHNVNVKEVKQKRGEPDYIYIFGEQSENIIENRTGETSPRLF
jgi:spermidine synthase